jgi:hypothetical protein
MNQPAAVLTALKLCPEGPHRGGGIQHVLGLEQAVNAGFAHTEGSQDESAVGDRFVARDSCDSAKQ